MPEYTISEAVHAGPPPRTLRLVGLAEPITDYVWEADGDITVWALLVSEKVGSHLYAVLYGEDVRGDAVALEVDAFSTLGGALSALLSEVTEVPEGRWPL